MRIESVTAHAFGPLSDARLDLASGLTVVVGANESAKSTWHAAIYAGLCGRRRGRGGVTRVDRAFEELRRPWDGDAWRASVVVRLDDGRRIEVTQDLAGRIDSSAVDADLGRDVSGAIMFEGSPDGSRWLGLDRYSFLATACITQAGLLAVLDEADGLQDHIARAAATAGTDANAATALAAIAAFAREHVGLDKQGARKPLRRAKEAVAAATDALASARADHERYLQLVAEAEVLRAAAEADFGEVTETRTHVEALERLLAATRSAADAAADADHTRERAQSLLAELETVRRRHSRAWQLDASVGGQAPTGAAESDELARTVADALAGWRTSNPPEPLTGDTAAELREQLERLPVVPWGDREVDPSVRQAAATLAERQAVLAAHAGLRPPEPGVDEDPDLTAAIEATAAVVRDLAADLASAAAIDAPDPSAVVGLDEAARRTRTHADGARALFDAAAGQPSGAPATSPAGAGPRGRALLLSGAGIGLAAGFVLLAWGMVLPGVTVIVVAGALGAWALTRPGASRAQTRDAGARGGGGSGAPTWAEVSEAERAALEAQERLRAARTAAAAAVTARSDAQVRCEARRLPADVPRLRALAAAAEIIRAQRTSHGQWSSDEAAYGLGAASARERLRQALVGRGVVAAADPAVDLRDLVREYERACAVRAEAAAAAARRPDLLERLAERQRAEGSFADAASRRQSAAAAVLRAAALARVVDADADAEAVAESLLAWQEERARQAQQADESRGEWAELVALLDGSTLERLRQHVDEVAARHGVQVGLVEAAVALSVDAARCRDALATQAGLDPAAVTDAGSVQGLFAAGLARLDVTRSEASRTARAADRAEAVRQERANGLASVAAAEEALAAEQARLDHVTQLATTLDLTADFLRRAQERVHRDIAPVLARTLEEWLPSITGGRYVNARVDPATLVVQVRGPHRPWRQADRLSVGTAEQVYLLLRVALAEHLTTKGETCPLLLDDVTVQADPVRTEAILDLLLRLSRDRQIVLFAQDPMVAQWAKSSLVGDRHSLIELPQLAAG